MTVSEELDRIRERLTALENKVESEASLRAMMDRDQAALIVRFDAQDKLLRALSVTQSEHGQQLREHTARLTRLEEGQRRHSQAFERVEAGIRDILTLLQNGGPAGAPR